MNPVRLLGRVSYKPGWVLKIGGPLNRFVCIFAATPDSNAVLDSSNQRRLTRVTQHQFEIPAIDDERGFYRWLFDRLLDAERHEAGEFFVVDGQRPFMPHHQDEGSPYTRVERWE